MSKWSVYRHDNDHDPITEGRKTADIYVPAEKSAKHIAEVEQYKTGDELLMAFRSGRSANTTVAKPSEWMELSDLPDDLAYAILGQLDATRSDVINALKRIYPNEGISEKTRALLAHFKLV